MDNVKARLEAQEQSLLCKYATLSANAERDFDIEPCDLRTEFQRDRDRILHCKSFRRLKHKTQVFISPEGDHYRTRLTHTLEVSQIARTIARALRLNEDLTEAIALGHDLGHTPFGHAGEWVLDRLVDGGFNHAKQSGRVVELLENNGRGLNLTKAVRNGIVNHRYDDKPATLEGEIVKYADRFAYINHDIEDAVRAGIISENSLPEECTSVLGATKSQRINNLIRDIVEESFDAPYVRQSSEFEKYTCRLHEYMFEDVYVNPEAKGEEKKLDDMLEMLFEHFLTHVEELPPLYRTLTESQPLDRVVADYIAGFTDRYAVRVFSNLFLPTYWSKI